MQKHPLPARGRYTSFPLSGSLFLFRPAQTYNGRIRNRARLAEKRPGHKNLCLMFLHNFYLKDFSSNKYFVSYDRDKSRNACRSSVKCELLPSDFNQIWNVHIMVSETLQYLVLRRRKKTLQDFRDVTSDQMNTHTRYEVNTALSQLQMGNRQDNCIALQIAIG
jgi:hypothetical protein